MITALKYNGYNLHNPAQGRVVSSVDILTSPDVLLSFLENKFTDGAIFTSKKFARRRIPIQVLIYNETGCTQQNLRNKVEFVKRVLYSAEEVEIEIGWGDYSIFFTGTAEKFEQKYFHDEGYAVVNFVLNCEPFYRDISGSEYNYNAITSDSQDFSVEGLGHVPSDVTYTVTVNIACTLTAILIENLDLGQKIGITPMGGFTANDIVSISDGEVKLNDQVVDYYGLPPEIDVGSNNMKINFLGCGIEEDQSQGEEGTKVWQSIYGENFMAHSFVPNFNAIYPRFDFKIKRHGYPYQQGEAETGAGTTWNASFGGNVYEGQTFTPAVNCILYGARTYLRRDSGATSNPQLLIKTGDYPSYGTTIFTREVNRTTISTAGEWVTFWDPTQAVALTAGLKYKVLMKTKGSTGPTNSYDWRVDTGNPYAGGHRGKWVSGTLTEYAGQDHQFEILVMATLLVRIETDDPFVPGTPSGNLVNAPSTEYQVELNANNFSIEDQEYDISVEYDTAVTALALLTTYHMVMRQEVTIGGSSNHHYLWAEANGGSHPGQANRSTDAGANWSSAGLADMIFKAYYDTGAGAFNVDLRINLQDKYV